MENPKKIFASSASSRFSFTGRDEDIHSGAPPAPALHPFAFAKGTSANQVGKDSATATVPDLLQSAPLPALPTWSRATNQVGFALLRLPPELRLGTAADDQQGNQGMGAPGSALPGRAQLTADVTAITDRARGKKKLLQLHDVHGV